MDDPFHKFGGLRLAALEAILSNDEASTDDELIQHFVLELDLTLGEARHVVSQHETNLRHLVASRVG